MRRVEYGEPHRSFRTLGASAVVILVALLVGGVLLLDRGSDTVRVGGQGPAAEPSTSPQTGPRLPSPTAPPIATTGVPRSPTTLAVPAQPPVLAVGSTDDGRLVVLDVATGVEQRELLRMSETNRSSSEGGASALGGLAVTPDGRSVFYSTCCSPAVGSTRVVPTGGGGAVLVADGKSPAVSPDGTTVAIVDAVLGIKLLTLDGGVVDVIKNRPDLSGALSSVGWSPDGQQLAVGAQGRVFLVGAGETSMVNAREVIVPTGRTWSSPVLRADGSMLVVEEAPGLAPVVRSVAANGAPQQVIDLGGRAPTSLSADASGGWVLVPTTTRILMMVGPDGATQPTAITGAFRGVDW
jgi:hypothetical protein